MIGRHALAPGRTARAALAVGTTLIAAVLVLASCSPSPPHPAQARGSSAPHPGRTHGASVAPQPVASTEGTPSPGTSAPPTGTSTGRLGSTLPVSDSHGTQLDITLTKVIDPASGANQYSKAGKGNHFVGVNLHVQNKAPSAYQNNANNETTIVISDGKTLHADYNPIANCGNFDNGQIKLSSGAATTGCVTFRVPHGQKVTEVSYGNTVFPGVTAQWRIS